MRDVDNSADVLDSRDVESRIDDLEGEQNALIDAVEEAEEAYTDAQDDEDTTEAQCDELGDELAAARMALREWQESWEAEELAKLTAFRAEVQDGTSEWIHGETLIRESYWVEYVQELLADIGDIPRDLPGYVVIDWEATADNIKADYSEADFDGITYYFRCC